MKKLCLSLAIMVLWCNCALADILRVRPGDYTSIQSAINAADHNDVIIVDPNRYYENINFLGKAITLKSSDPNNSSIIATTIIDGNRPADVNYGSAVIFNSGEDNDSVLTGFTITGGTGSWAVISWEFKGLRWNRCGGGVLCYNMSRPTITKNVFVDNTAGEGGGIYIYGDPGNPANPYNPTIHLNPVITENTFTSNSAIVEHGYDPPNTDYPTENHGDGGAIVAFQGCDPALTNNIMQNNHADSYGGAIHFRQWSNGQISNNQILNNDSALGAGIHITYISRPTVTDNLIKGNIAGDFGGGGIYLYYYSNSLVENNLIIENESTNGAGIGVYWSSKPTIKNNIIANNINGAGILVRGSAIPVIVNNTIVGNDGSFAYGGGGIEVRTDTAPFIENNIITSNGNNYGIYASSVPPVIKYNNIWGHPVANYNSVITDQTGFNGNISVDPLFVDDVNGDYHLKSAGLRWDPNNNLWLQDQNTSECIDAGNPGYPLADELLTIPDDPNGENLRINLGAFGGTVEASLPPYYWAILADITNDGIVDTNDLNDFQQFWLDTGSKIPADLNRNNAVNFIDFALLANDWLSQTSWY